MIVDLTHTLKDKITVYPGTPDPAFAPLSTIEKDGFAEQSIGMTTHTGTHIDAPCHILPGTRSLDAFPLEKFIGKGVVLDCTQVSAITLPLLQQNAEALKEADFILFYTGWQDKWNTPHYFDPFPTLTTEAVEWLLQFHPKALGFDAISVDTMTDEALPNHHLLLQQEVLILENLANLDQLIGKQFQLF
ncbi:MAG TPA: cyclase family protein, partial [Chitinophagaceae bacterium]